MLGGCGMAKAQACEEQPCQNDQTVSPLSQTPEVAGDEDKHQERDENQKHKEKCRL